MNENTLTEQKRTMTVTIDGCVTPLETLHEGFIYIDDRKIAFKDIGYQDLKKVKSVSILDLITFDSEDDRIDFEAGGVYMAVCPCCSTKQIALLEKDERQVMCFCVTDLVCIGKFEKPPMIARFKS